MQSKTGSDVLTRPTPPTSPARRLEAAIAARQAGQMDAADALLRALIDDGHASVEVWFHRARIAMIRRDYAAAITGFDAALALSPTDRVCRANKAHALRLAGDPAAGGALLDALVADGAQDAILFKERGRCHVDAGEPDAAVGAFRQATSRAPDDPEAWALLANTLRDVGDGTAALLAAQTAHSLDPASTLARYALASASIALGHYREGLAIGMPLALADPTHHDMRFNLAWAQLATGAFAAGWRDFESRRYVYRHLAPIPDGLAPLTEPPSPGMAIAVIGEQGFGDALQFVRFALRLARAGVEIHLRTEPRLVRLMSDQQVFASVEPYGAPLAAHVRHAVPLLSLPTLLATGEDLTPTGRYLASDPARVRRMRQWLGDGTLDRLTIGLQWRGNPAGTIDRGRSVPVEAMRALASLPGVTPVILQRPPGLDEWTALPDAPKARIAPLTLDRDGAFVDTAALIDCLDLVITCDTSIAHLTGALGRPGLVLLKSHADWRWMTGDGPSRWYPSLSLIRQSRPGDWGPVIDTIVSRLRRHPLIAGGRPSA